MYQDILKKYHEDLVENNGQMISRWEYFAAEDVAGHSKLDGKTRCMAILAVLLGCQGKEEFKRMLQVALDCGVSPVQAKEIRLIWAWAGSLRFIRWSTKFSKREIS